MSDDDAPKSAVELALERLNQKDAGSGLVARAPTDEQKAAIAEARNLHASRIAELEILHRSKMATLLDPAERVRSDEDYRREIVRLHDDLERKVERIRAKRD